MCRILATRSERPVDATPWIDAFRVACRESREYQGHGWGVAWLEDGAWQRYRTVTPIWEDDFAPPPSTVVLVHARSAFRNEGIEVENNMPFLGDRLAFAFNGELRGVRLKVPGETGAARLHTMAERFLAEGATSATSPTASVPHDVASALTRLDQVVRARTDYVRALNLVVSDGRDLVAHCRYSEDPEYFTLWSACHVSEADLDLVCSDRIEGPGVAPQWRALADGETLRIDGSVPCFS